MSDLSDTKAATHPEGGSGIRAEPNAQLDAQVLGYGLDANSLGRPFADPSEFCFSGRERDRGLGCALELQAVGAAQCRAAVG